MVAHLEWNCSRLRKLMKLSPGPVSVHPSQVSCITLQSLEPGCEAKERSAVGRRKSIARDCHEVPRFICVATEPLLLPSLLVLHFRLNDPYECILFPRVTELRVSCGPHLRHTRPN